MGNAKKIWYCWVFAALLLAVSTVEPAPALATHVSVFAGQYAASTAEGADDDSDDAMELGHQQPDRAGKPETPSEDGTGDTPEIDRVPNPAPGCIFQNQPLELLV